MLGLNIKWPYGCQWRHPAERSVATNRYTRNFNICGCGWLHPTACPPPPITIFCIADGCRCCSNANEWSRAEYRLRKQNTTASGLPARRNAFHIMSPLRESEAMQRNSTQRNAMQRNATQWTQVRHRCSAVIRRCGVACRKMQRQTNELPSARDSALGKLVSIHSPYAFGGRTRAGTSTAPRENRIKRETFQVSIPQVVD